MAKPGRRSFFGIFLPVCYFLTLLVLSSMPTPALAQGAMVPSGMCPSTLVHDSYKADIDRICDLSGPLGVICSPCVCIRSFKGSFEKQRMNLQTLLRKESIPEIFPFVDQINEALGQSVWCRVNFILGPGGRAILGIIRALGSLAFYGGALSTLILNLLDFVVGQVINMIVTFACSAITALLNYLASLICIPFFNLNITLPRFLFSFGPTTCNGLPIGTFTGFPPPPPPLIYSSIPRINYRSKVHVISP